jgi:uncharacterized protein DUF6894
MPHYFFDLTDGFTRRDRNGLDCDDDAEAIIKGNIISREVAVAASDHSGPALHISIVNEAGREVSQIPVIWPLSSVLA